MAEDNLDMLLRLVVALVAGAIVGYERSYRGRPAGFRTHALVCTASSLLMLVTVYESHWMSSLTETVRLDPTRMAQGIMTGIGFLGAGVIMKEGLSVRGLTTAASIWITAALGILAGIGFYFPLVVSMLLTVSVLSVFRWLEARMPTQVHYHFEIRFERDSGMTEQALMALLKDYGFSVASPSYRLDEKGRIFRQSMMAPYLRLNRYVAAGGDPQCPPGCARIPDHPGRRLNEVSHRPFLHDNVGLDPLHAGKGLDSGADLDQAFHAGRFEVDQHVGFPADATAALDLREGADAVHIHVAPAVVVEQFQVGPHAGRVRAGDGRHGSPG